MARPRGVPASTSVRAWHLLALLASTRRLAASGSLSGLLEISTSWWPQPGPWRPLRSLRWATAPLWCREGAQAALQAALQARGVSSRPHRRRAAAAAATAGSLVGHLNVPRAPPPCAVRQPLRKNVLERRQPAAEPLPSPALLLPPCSTPAQAPSSPQPVQRVRPSQYVPWWPNRIRGFGIIALIAAWNYYQGMPLHVVVLVHVFLSLVYLLTIFLLP